MYSLYVGLIIVVCVFALIGTIIVGKNITKSEEDEEIEINPSATNKSIKQNTSIITLTIIYSITFLVTIALIWIFVF